MDSPTYQVIEDSTLAALDRQEELVAEYAEAGDKLADADLVFKRDYAKACLEFRENMKGSKINEDMVGNHATVETTTQRSAYLVAKAKEEAEHFN